MRRTGVSPYEPGGIELPLTGLTCEWDCAAVKPVTFTLPATSPARFSLRHRQQARASWYSHFGRPMHFNVRAKHEPLMYRLPPSQPRSYAFYYSTSWMRTTRPHIFHQLQRDPSTHFPETLQLASSLSSLSAIPSASPALPRQRLSPAISHMVSALLVRKLSRVILPANGPATSEPTFCCSELSLPRASSKGVVVGHHASPISLG
jgi:hypothetical protein